MFDPKFIVKKTFTAERINRALSWSELLSFRPKGEIFPFQVRKSAGGNEREKDFSLALEMTTTSWWRCGRDS
jgi:hypothetical protein